MREWLAEHLPRWLAILLGIRRVAPEGDDPGHWPWRSVHVEPLADTGGTFRAAWRMQDPARDPTEPYGNESSSAGSDHGWSNCTMCSGALAMAYQQPRGAKAPWGGDLRHHQADQSGGTDLYDLRTAWAEYGETLTIKSGQGWSALSSAHAEGRAIVIQGSGNVPGSESFDGGHACVIAPETHSNGQWLFGDPLADGWQWITPSAIRTWAEHWQSSVAFAVGEKPPPPEPPEPPEPPPEPKPPEPYDPRPALEEREERGASMALDDAVAAWLEWITYRGRDAWGVAEWGCGRWARGGVLDPLASAINARDTVPAWGALGWRAMTWG